MKITQTSFLKHHAKSVTVLLHAKKLKANKNQIEFIDKISQGLTDYENNRVHSFEETFAAIDKLIKK